MNAERTLADAWIRLTPGLFVFLWSTGFIGAKLGLPHAEPATFLSLRFLLVLALMLPLALLLRAPWPTSRAQVLHLAVAGVLVHGGYLMGVFSAIQAGMSAGVVALVVGLQPLLTGLAAAPLLGERVTPRQWTGLLLGIAGVALVVMQKATVAGLTAFAVLMGVIGLLSITAGTLYQKRWCGAFDLRTGSVVQFAAALAVLAPVALLFEYRPVAWTASFVFALAWLVIVLSIAAISLLALLIRRGEATKVVSLFYLTPPVTAVLAYVAFGEVFTPLAILGMVVSAVGVAMVTQGR
jgi:drug/metabolite transporter (DMT)-like permease